MSFAKTLLDKSTCAALAAIEIYNKPTFLYREETFALLMCNSWELLLKAKRCADRGDDPDSLNVYENGSHGAPPKKNRSGTLLSIGLHKLVVEFEAQKNLDFKKECRANIEALMGIRDAAAHLVNNDPYLARRVLQIGMASLRNYVTFSQAWFSSDFSEYNFFLMPVSFYHGFEAAEPASRLGYSAQIQKLLEYLDLVEKGPWEGDAQDVSIKFETHLKKGSVGIEFQFTKDPKAAQLYVAEEDVLKNFPLSYQQLVKALRERYSNFIENQTFHDRMKPIRSDAGLCHTRFLDPSNTKGGSKKRFFNPNVFKHFDKHYAKR